MRITLPDTCLVVLIGVTGSGKSTFARRHFAPTRVLSSDQFRAMLADDENDQSVTAEAFETLHYVAGKRLAAGRLTVVDATNVEDWARAELIKVAKRHRRPAVAIVLDVPIELALERNLQRGSPRPPPSAIRRQHRWLADSLPSLALEGFEAVHVLQSVADIDAARVERSPRVR